MTRVGRRGRKERGMPRLRSASFGRRIGKREKGKKKVFLFISLKTVSFQSSDEPARREEGGKEVPVRKEGSKYEKKEKRSLFPLFTNRIP